jgi:hypothetical protein
LKEEKSMRITYMAMVAAIAVLLAANHSHAFSGKSLEDSCLNHATVPWCCGYLSAVVEAGWSGIVYKNGSMSDVSVNLICVPDGTSQSQLRRVFIKYTGEHPEELHMHSLELSRRAFNAYFPCK